MKKSLTTLLTLTLAIFGMQIALTTAAHACEPAESHYPSITVDDTPDCLQIEAFPSFQEGRITLRNECDEIFELESTSCEACDSQASIEPGAEAYQLIIDARGAEELDGQVTQQSYSWTLGEQEGVLETEVDFNDTSGACDDWNNGGCSSSNSSAPIGDTPLVLLFVLVLFMRSYGAIALTQTSN